MSDVRWEPVGDDDDIGEISQYSRATAAGLAVELGMDTDTDYGMVWRELPPDIRLCRAVPAEPWSQEPPTEPGYYEVWHEDWRSETGDAVYVDYITVYGKKVISDKMLEDLPAGTWYKRLHLSQPPGEVGE